MEEAELLVVIGSRAVCQADCSGTGWPKVSTVINLNADPVDVQHYNATLALPGDAALVADRLAAALASLPALAGKADWLRARQRKKPNGGVSRCAARMPAPRLIDAAWSQASDDPAAGDCRRRCRLRRALARSKFFDAGDVQANGFQTHPGRCARSRPITESGASYMGFAVSALLAQPLADKGRYGVAFTGDGSFMMNPQVLIDGVEHGVHGTILLFDNRRMAAISSLQEAQYGVNWRTNDGVAVDYCAWPARWRVSLPSMAAPRPVARRLTRPMPTGPSLCMCRSILAPTRRAAWAPMGAGTSATGSPGSRQPI